VVGGVHGWSVGARAHRDAAGHTVRDVHGRVTLCTSAPDARALGECPCTPDRGRAHGARCARGV